MILLNISISISISSRTIITLFKQPCQQECMSEKSSYHMSDVANESVVK
jgi:hypothetical protein